MKKVRIEIRVGAHRGKKVYAYKKRVEDVLIRPYETSNIMYKVVIKSETIWLSKSEVIELNSEWKYKT